MPDSFQYDVFLSHNQADKPRSRPLAERLRAAGLRHTDFGFRISAAGCPIAGGSGIGQGGPGSSRRSHSPKAAAQDRAVSPSEPRLHIQEFNRRIELP
jgi:hypothetical protein